MPAGSTRAELAELRALYLSLSYQLAQFGKLGVIEPQPVSLRSHAGLSPLVARADHIHAHGHLAGGSTHALATANQAGFLSAAQFSLLSALESANVPTAFPWTLAGELAIGPAGSELLLQSDALSPWDQSLSTLTGGVQRGDSFAGPSFVLRQDVSSRPGWVLVQPPADGNVNIWGTRPTTVPNDAAWVLPLSLDNPQDAGGALIMAVGLSQSVGNAHDSDNNVFILVILQTDRTWVLSVERNEAAVNLAAPAVTFDSLLCPFRYLALRRTGSTWQGYVSDGQSWTFLGSVTTNIAPDRIVLAMGAFASPNPIVGLGPLVRVPTLTL